MLKHSPINKRKLRIDSPTVHAEELHASKQTACLELDNQDLKTHLDLVFLVETGERYSLLLLSVVVLRTVTCGSTFDVFVSVSVVCVLLSTYSVLCTLW